MSLNFVSFGPHDFGDESTARCVVTVGYKSSSKVDEKESDGKSDAVTTFKGAKPCDIDVEIQWVRRPAIAADLENEDRIKRRLAQLSPRGPNPGTPWEFSHEDADINGAYQVIVKELDGPNRKPGSSEVSAKLKCASWAQPSATAQGQGQGQTPDKADKVPPDNPSPDNQTPNPADGATAHGGQGAGGGVWQSKGFRPGTSAPSVKP